MVEEPLKRRRRKAAPGHELERRPVSDQVYDQPDWLRDMQAGRASHRPESRLSQGELTTLRYAAGLHYATDMNGCTLGDMKRLPVFSALKLKTLEQWCEQDKWMERRHANLAEWRGLIEQRIGESIVQTRLNELKRMEDMLSTMYSLLGKTNDDGVPLVRPKSYEGVVNAIGKLTERADNFRTSIAAALTPRETDKKDVSKTTAPPANLLSMEDMRDVAHAMMRKASDNKPKTSAAEEQAENAPPPQEDTGVEP